MTQRDSLNRVVDRIGDLTAMPKVVGEVLRLTDDPAVPITQLSDAVERDPALAAKILRVSNSPYYGLRGHVATLKLALVVLGVREVRNIALGISVFEVFSNRRTEMLMAKGFWEHVVSVAGLSKMLAERLKLGLHGEDFVSGLLHDIGKLILWHELGDAYAGVYEASGGAAHALCASERDVFGFDHTDAGAALAERWNLPDSLVEAIWRHHAKPDKALADAENPQLAAVIRIANLAAREVFVDTTEAVSQACAEEEAWALLDSAPSVIPQESRFEVLRVFREELDRSPLPTI